MQTLSNWDGRKVLRATVFAALLLAALRTPLAAQCTYTISPSSASGAAGGGVGSFTVSTQAGCTWTAVANTSWLTVSNFSSSTVNYAYPANPNLSARSGSITIQDANSNPVQTFTLNQAGGTCTYTLSATSASFTSGGGNGSFSVFATAGCSWTATTNGASWVTITSGTGTGNGTVTYTVAQNTSTTGEAAIITVGTQTFTITESAACSLTLTPVGQEFPYTGGAGSISVSATATNCDRTAVSNNTSWLTITFGQTGTGNGTVGFSVAQNTAATQRTGTITIGGTATFTVTEDAAPNPTCTFTVSPTSVSATAASGEGNFSVTASASSCPWTAVSNNNWITVSFGQSGTGNGTVGYAYSSNTSLTPQTGTITVGNATFTITQAGGSCTYSISPTSATVPTGGGSGSFTVTATAGCSWTPTSNEPWLTVTSGPGSGNGLVVYSATPNTTSATQTATIIVGTQTFTVTQPGPCTFALSPTSQNFPYTGGTGSITVTASASSCAWSVVNSNSSWITINSGASGTGSGLITFTAAANPNTTGLSATLTIGGSQIFSVSEDPAPVQTCVYTLSTYSVTASANGASGTINVTASAPNCSWTATPNVSWISITSAPGATGSGSVTWAVPANPTLASQVGTISIATQTFTITQSAGTCSYTLTPQTGEVGPAGGADSFNVTTGPACNWTAASNNPDWLTVVSGSGPGNGNVTLSVAPNPGLNARNGTVSVGTQIYTETEDGACVLTLSATSAQFYSNTATGNFDVIASSNSCSRAAVSDSTWLTVSSSSANATGSGTVNYSVAANTQTQQRVGHITVGGSQVFTVTQAAPFCNFSINPPSANFSQAGGTGSFAVTTTCSWTAVAADPTWVTITGSASGTGNGTITYTVSANNSATSRQTSISIGTMTYTISQAVGACTLQINPTTASAVAAGGTGSIAITTTCSWSATSNVSWITFATAASGTGSGVLNYIVAPNLTPQAQTGQIIINGQIFSLYQAANGCPITLSPTSASAPPSASSGSFSVSTPCNWTATTSASWITITSGSGTGSGSVSYSVAGNPTGQSRSGTITVGNQSFTIVQAATACTFSISPASTTVPASGGVGVVAVTAVPGCAWTAASGVSWVTVTLPGATSGSASVSGNGVVNYSVAANTSQTSRTANALIAGQTFVISQAAGAPQLSLAAVLNAASYSSGAVAPGEIVTLFGQGIGPTAAATLQLTPDGGSLTNSIGSTQVLFDGNPAPMVYASDQQVTAIVPYAVGANPTTQVQVRYQGQPSNTLTLSTAASAPGIFSANFSGGGQGAILNQDYTINTSTNPAVKGSEIMIFATGEGRTNPAGVDGRLAPDVLASIPMPVQKVSVAIGGINVTPDYAGGAPGLVAGVLQVNARIPTNVVSGNQTVVITVGSASSQSALTVAVK
jgi:uncharacterized protein (TIGR03437 family)